jgi:hypothetical protein
MLSAVRGQGLEGVVAKRKDSIYESGQRTGSWVKYRVNRGQELVIGGYIPGSHDLDSIIVGYYRGEELAYARSKRLCSGFAASGFRETTPFDRSELSVCESSRNSQRAVGHLLIAIIRDSQPDGQCPALALPAGADRCTWSKGSQRKAPPLQE